MANEKGHDPEGPHYVSKSVVPGFSLVRGYKWENLKESLALPSLYLAR